jgi:hypothetical protein
MARRHPSPGRPSIRSPGTITSSRNTSANSSTPCIVRSGLTVIPGVSMSTKNAVIPPWPGATRVSSTQRAANWARLVQTFWPVITQASPRGTARVASEARSLPEPGSEKPWHHCSRPLSSSGTIVAASAGRA